MVVLVAVHIHHAAAVPKGGSPAAPVGMSVIRIENEPAAFHLCITKLQAASTRHLALIKRKVHVLGGVSVLVIDS